MHGIIIDSIFDTIVAFSATVKIIIDWQDIVFLTCVYIDAITSHFKICNSCFSSHRIFEKKTILYRKLFSTIMFSHISGNVGICSTIN